MIYEGRPINKPLLTAIFLIFRNKKIQDIRFVGNSICNIFGKFRNYDVTSNESVLFIAQQGYGFFRPVIDNMCGNRNAENL
jgi:hypothetical protein